MTPLFAFVACRDFYITCERNYNPSLEGKPVVLLDENECIQALSAEARQLGLQRGVPLFLYADRVRQQGVVVYHINELLCQDMMKRLQEMLQNFGDPLEVWAPGRLFIPLFDPVDYRRGDKVTWIAEQLLATVKVGTGMYAHVGIAPTRTLAQMAACLGFKDFTNRQLQEEMLQRLGVGSVWGVSPTYKEFLRAVGIHTAFDLREADDQVVRQVMGVVGLRLALELRNISCLEPPDFPALVPEILSWRKFAQPLTKWEQLQETIGLTVSLMAQQLQAQHLVTRLMAISLYPTATQQNITTTLLKLPVPLNTPQELVNQAQQALRDAFTVADSYDQLRIVCGGLSSTLPLGAAVRQSESTMRRMDSVNQRMGTSAVEIAEAGMQQLQQSRLSRRLQLPLQRKVAEG
ncbi:MAG: hypothetical protein ACK421_07440 [Pseudanabaenaceae cyanobacterium]